MSSRHALLSCLAPRSSGFQFPPNLQPDMSSYLQQPFYDEILRNMPIACVDIAVVTSGSVLLVRRSDPPAKCQWWVPGGRVLKGERMRQTARRKALEEVGIECHVGPIIHTAET